MNNAPKPDSSTPKRGFFSVVKLIVHWIARTFRFIRVTIANIFVVLLLLVVVVLFTSDDSVRITKGTVLMFTPHANLVEQTTPSPHPAVELLFGENTANETNVHDVIKVLRRAARDPRIVALQIRPQFLQSASLIHLEMLGQAIKEFSAAGKRVISHASDYGQSQYLLASYADDVWLDPLGSFFFSGITFDDIYFKQLLDKLHINVHVFRSGIYKSAVEPFMLDSMSDDVKLSYAPIVQQLWSKVTQITTENRALDAQAVENFVVELEELLHASNKDPARLAVDTGFVDRLVSVSALNSELAAQVPSLAAGATEVPTVSVTDYRELMFLDQEIRSAPPIDSESRTSAKFGTIAVVPVEGGILHTFDRDSGMTYDTTSAVKNLRKAREDDVDAVLLRVNSPGGTVIGSEEIRQQVATIQSLGIPVVVSMSGVAASGGYWIAAEADYIFASETTITGSIGVFSFLPSFEDSLAKIGVHTDGVEAIQGGFRMDSIGGLSTVDQLILQASVDSSYSAFLERVSRGRNMTVEEVDAIAGGRIWTGLQAKEVGLVDELGNFDEAAERAAVMVGLGRFELVFYDAEPSSFLDNPFFIKIEQLLPSMTSSERLLVKNINQIYKDLRKYTYFEPRTVYAYCENCEYF